MLPEEMLFSFKITNKSNSIHSGQFLDIPQKMREIKVGETFDFSVNGNELRKIFTEINRRINMGLSFEITNNLKEDEINYMERMSKELFDNLKLSKVNKKTKLLTPKEYMKLAIDEMKKSIPEKREDSKTSPKVGAIVVKPDGNIEKAFRGELRQGDHAEFTLIERKNRANSLDGSILYATLEPCAPGARKHPKLGCAERIVNARISKVYIGIEDPDPTVDRKGIKFLQDNGIEVEMFTQEFQDIIREENKDFLEQAQERAKKYDQEENKKEITLSENEHARNDSDLSDLSDSLVNEFLKTSSLDISIGSKEFNKIFTQIGILELKDNKYVPTGIGILLFGKNPQFIYPQSVIKATLKIGKSEEIMDIKGSLLEQPTKIESWYKNNSSKAIDRDSIERKEEYEIPIKAFREAIINAIVHRDYDIEGAPIYVDITENEIIIKSPGMPVSPVKKEQIENFTAPSLSRNPKIMYIFNQMKLAEQRGLGFKTLRELPQEFHLPKPKVTFEDPYIVMIFSRIKNIKGNVENSNNLDKEDLKELDFIKQKEIITKKEYSEKFSYSDRTSERHLKKFVELGYIEKKGSGNSTYYQIKQ